MNKKIRLVTVTGSRVDTLEYMINHYYQIVDEMHIVVYDTNNNQYENVKEITKNYKDKIFLYKHEDEQEYNWETVTSLYNEIKNQYPDDWWIVSDDDEFHVYPKPLNEIINDCEENNWDIVRGACPNKICIVKGNIEITPGQHYAKIEGQTTWRWQGWNHPAIAPTDKYNVQVHHFKWDKTVIDRIKKVADIRKDYAYSDEYLKMYQSLRSNNFELNVKTPDYIFEYCPVATYESFKGWKKLFNKIISI